MKKAIAPTSIFLMIFITVVAFRYTPCLPMEGEAPRIASLQRIASLRKEIAALEEKGDVLRNKLTEAEDAGASQDVCTSIFQEQLENEVSMVRKEFLLCCLVTQNVITETARPTISYQEAADLLSKAFNYSVCEGIGFLEKLISLAHAHQHRKLILSYIFRGAINELLLQIESCEIDLKKQSCSDKSTTLERILCVLQRDILPLPEDPLAHISDESERGIDIIKTIVFYYPQTIDEFVRVMSLPDSGYSPYDITAVRTAARKAPASHYGYGDGDASSVSGPRTPPKGSAAGGYSAPPIHASSKTVAPAPAPSSAPGYYPGRVEPAPSYPLAPSRSGDMPPPPSSLAPRAAPCAYPTAGYPVTPPPAPSVVSDIPLPPSSRLVDAPAPAPSAPPLHLATTVDSGGTHTVDNPFSGTSRAAHDYATHRPTQPAAAAVVVHNPVARRYPRPEDRPPHRPTPQSPEASDWEHRTRTSRLARFCNAINPFTKK